jgi:hypothetical protein
MSECQVQFVGGPADGYSQRIVSPAQTFLGVAMLRGRHRGLLRWLLAVLGWGRASSQVIGLAVYELDEQDGCWRYRYVGTHQTTCDRLPRLDRRCQVPIPVAECRTVKVSRVWK